ncbi:MAG TPA: YceI family protein [Terriglobia bacterium]|nr:YceI family protein [Terriglobia bacterium]
MRNLDAGAKAPSEKCRWSRQVARAVYSIRNAPAPSFMGRRFPLPLLAFLIWYSAGSRPLGAQVAGTYQVDPSESKIEIHLFKGGFFSSLGDNHLINLTRFSGTALLSPMSPWKADMTADTTSLKVIDPWGNPDERKEVEETMLGPQQLDASRFPKIELHSVSFDPVSQDTTWDLLADVQLHGVTRREHFSLDCQQFGDKLQIRGRKMFKLTDFNIQPFSKAFGAVKVKNEFEVTYNIVLHRIR